MGASTVRSAWKQQKRKRNRMDILKLGLITVIFFILMLFGIVGIIALTDNIGCDEWEQHKVPSSCYKSQCDGIDPVTGEFFTYKNVCVKRSDDD